MKKYIFCSCLALFSLMAQAQLPSGNLVAHWDFNGGSVDEIFIGVPCTVQGFTATIAATPGVNGLPNQAVEFSGNSYVTLNHPNIALQSWTIKAVVAVYDIGGLYQNNRFIWKGSPGSNSYYDLYLSNGPYNTFLDNNLPPGQAAAVHTNAPVFGTSAAGAPIPADIWYKGSFNPNPGTQPVVDLSLPLYQWHCVVASYDHMSERISLYVDGVQYVDEMWANQYGPPTLEDLHIGCDNGVFILDDVAIYDVAIPANTDLIADCEICQDPALVCKVDYEDYGNIDAEINGALVPPTTVTPGGFFNTSGRYGNGQYGNTIATGFPSGNYMIYPYDAALDLSSWTIAAVVQPGGFWSGHCEVNTILERGPYQSTGYYSLNFLDNEFDGACGVYTPWREVYGAGVCGPSAPPTGTFLGGGMNPFITAGRWYCVVASYDGVNGILDLYVDGVHTVSVPHANTYSYPNPTPADLIIGASKVAGGAFSNFFEGLIEEFRIYAGPVCPQTTVTCGQKPGPPPLPIDVVLGEGKMSVYELMGQTEAKLVPNPAKDNVHITLPGDWGTAAYTLINTLGATVASGKLHRETTLDVSDFSNGLYVLIVKDGSKVSKQKLIVNH